MLPASCPVVRPGWAEARSILLSHGTTEFPFGFQQCQTVSPFGIRHILKYKMCGIKRLPKHRMYGIKRLPKHRKHGIKRLPKHGMYGIKQVSKYFIFRNFNICRKICPCFILFFASILASNSSHIFQYVLDYASKFCCGKFAVCFAGLNATSDETPRVIKTP